MLDSHATSTPAAAADPSGSPHAERSEFGRQAVHLVGEFTMRLPSLGIRDPDRNGAGQRSAGTSRTASTPSRSKRQNASGLFAPGKRQPMPTMATGSDCACRSCSSSVCSSSARSDRRLVERFAIWSRKSLMAWRLGQSCAHSRGSSVSFPACARGEESVDLFIGKVGNALQRRLGSGSRQRLWLEPTDHWKLQSRHQVRRSDHVGANTWSRSANQAGLHLRSSSSPSVV